MPDNAVKKTVKHLNPQPEPPCESTLKTKNAQTGPKGKRIKPY